MNKLMEDIHILCVCACACVSCSAFQTNSQNNNSKSEQTSCEWQAKQFDPALTVGTCLSRNGNNVPRLGNDFDPCVLQKISWMDA